MDLVAGDAREILLAIGLDDWAARQVAGDLVEFCRLAHEAEDVLFAWSI
jgi:hypothetical protein